MVKHNRIIFELDNIRALRLLCKYCGREAVQSIESTEVGKQCPFCHKDWEADFPNGNRGDNWMLVRTMQDLLKVDSPRMTIRFEIDGDEDV